MRGAIGLGEMLRIYLSVKLGGGERAVPQKLLQAEQIRTGGQKMRCKAVA